MGRKALCGRFEQSRNSGTQAAIRREAALPRPTPYGPARHFRRLDRPGQLRAPPLGTIQAGPTPACLNPRGIRETTLVFDPSHLEHPIVQAPMGGGPSTPELAAAVCEAGGLGFLAAGYRTVADVGREIDRLRSLTERPFGLNVFVPPGPAADPWSVAAYAERVAGEGELGEPRHHDDAYLEKLALAADKRVPVLSTNFGAPSGAEIQELHSVECSVWVTTTTADEARRAAAAGADALIVQGTEAGGHRASFDDAAPGDIGLLALLQLTAAVTDLPLIATGGIVTGAGVAAALAAGAAAVQLGTAFMLTPEAGTSPAHRAAIARPGETGLTRAFTGRTARGILNRFQREHSGCAVRVPGGSPSHRPHASRRTASVVTSRAFTSGRARRMNSPARGPRRRSGARAGDGCPGRPRGGRRPSQRLIYGRLPCNVQVRNSTRVLRRDAVLAQHRRAEPGEQIQPHAVMMRPLVV